ncbi:hypothetical protein C8F01DRAFT_1257646 [Mycena amicta]|nr:hypothetical protein C8F01DRAFT_1257646 [Mycena amicta]
MQLIHWQSFVLLVLAATGITYASPTAPAASAPIASPIVSAETEAKLAAIGAQLRNETARGLEKRTVHCQTTTSSPAFNDAWTAGWLIRSMGAATFCCQENISGSGCTTMATWGTAAGVGHLRHRHQLTRHQLHWLRRLLGNGLIDIADSCNIDTFTQGYADFAQADGGPFNLILFHT